MVPRPGRTLAAFASEGRDNKSVVVFEAGLGGDHASWDAVATGVAEFATVVTYDRAGYGASPSADDPRDLAALVDDLIAVCATVAAGRPTVLVGHSLGGRIARAAAARNEHALSGLVLIEPAVDGVMTAFPKLARSYRRVFMIGSVLGPLGAFRLAPLRRALAGARTSDPARVDALIAQVSRRDYWQLVRREWKALSEPTPVGSTDSLPTVAMVADRWTDWGPRQVRVTGADSVDLLRHVRADIERMTAGNPRARTIVVTNTTHDIPADRPEIVVEAIRSLLAQQQRQR